MTHLHMCMTHLYMSVRRELTDHIHPPLSNTLSQIHTLSHTERTRGGTARTDNRDAHVHVLPARKGGCAA